MRPFEERWERLWAGLGKPAPQCAARLEAQARANLAHIFDGN